MGRTIVETWRLLLTARIEWVLLAVLLYGVAWLCASGRWRLIVRTLGGRIGWASASLATIAGIAVNNLTPTARLGGEACRIAITRLRGDLSLSRGALASLCDRLSDVPLITLIALFAIPALPTVTGSSMRAIAVGLAIAGALWLVFGRRLRQRLHAWRAWWQLEGLQLRWSTIGGGLGLSFLVWVEDVLRLMAVGRAFDVPLSISQAAALVVVGVFGGFVPTLGGLGAVEGALVGTLVLFGVPLETAIAITTVERAISYGLSTGLGAVVVATLGGRRLWAGRAPDAQPS